MPPVLPERKPPGAKGAVVLALAVLVVSMVSAGIVAARSMSAARHGVDAPASILARHTVNGTRVATVRFATTSGAGVVTTIHICHHQRCPVGGIVLVRYQSSQPMRAWERDMPPRANLAFAAGIILVGWLLSIALLAGLVSKKHHRMTAPPRTSEWPSQNFSDRRAQVRP